MIEIHSNLDNNSEGKIFNKIIAEKLEAESEDLSLSDDNNLSKNEIDINKKTKQLNHYEVNILHQKSPEKKTSGIKSQLELL